MFCTSCGVQVAGQPGYCPQCGKPLPAVVRAAGARPLASHLNLLSILWFVAAAIYAIPAAVLLAIGAGAGLAIHSTEAGPAAFLGPIFFYCLGGIIAALAVANFLCGWGLHKIRPWGRTLAIVMGILALVHVPLGTALGVYTLIVLSPADAARQYEQLSLQAQTVMA